VSFGESRTCEVRRASLLRIRVNKNHQARLRFLVDEEHALAKPVRCGRDAGVSTTLVYVTDASSRPSPGGQLMSVGGGLRVSEAVSSLSLPGLKTYRSRSPDQRWSSRSAPMPAQPRGPVPSSPYGR
jgi:hypothetical protein